jgi:hypothetical protein
VTTSAEKIVNRYTHSPKRVNPACFSAAADRASSSQPNPHYPSKTGLRWRFLLTPEFSPLTGCPENVRNRSKAISGVSSDLKKLILTE